MAGQGLPGRLAANLKQWQEFVSQPLAGMRVACYLYAINCNIQ